MYVCLMILISLLSLTLCGGDNNGPVTQTKHSDMMVNGKAGTIERELHLLSKRVHLTETYIKQNHIDMKSMRESIQKLTVLVQNNNGSTHAQLKKLAQDVKTISTKVAQLHKSVSLHGEDIRDTRDQIYNQGNELIRHRNTIAILEGELTHQRELTSNQTKEITDQRKLISNQGKELSNQRGVVSHQGTQLKNQGLQLFQQKAELAAQDKRLSELARKVERLHPRNATTTTTVTPTELTTTSSSTTSATTSSTSTTVQWVYYPPGSHAHRAQRFYPKLGAKFVDFGQPSNAVNVTYGGDLSFDDCLTWFSKIRAQNNHYTDMVYVWDKVWCLGHMNGTGHTGFEDRLHYTFH